MSDHTGKPLMVYVPGLKPKPEPRAHRQQLLRCLLEGLRRVDSSVATEIQAHDYCFDIVGWTYQFYGEHRDLGLDLASIDALIEQGSATDRDRAEAGSWQRRFLRWVFRLVDRFPILMQPVADENLKMQLRDLRRYIRNDFDMGEFVRRLLKMPLRAAWRSHRPTMLIGHSMGSIIAYDALWQLSQELGSECKVDLFLTMGSPLGQAFIQRRVKGGREDPDNRYPRNIRRWVNIAAVGDLTAIDMDLEDDFDYMTSSGLVESFEDRQFYNHYRQNGRLNPHSEYGYLLSEETADCVAAWWRTVRPVRDSA